MWARVGAADVESPVKEKTEPIFRSSCRKQNCETCRFLRNHVLLMSFDVCPTFATFGSSLMFSVDTEGGRFWLYSSSMGSSFILMEDKERDGYVMSM